MPSAEMTAALYRVHKVKSATPRWFNPAAAALFALEAHDQVPKRAANTFLDLLNAGTLPSWVTQAVDVEFIKAAAK
ncbi:MAG: hypothetical protein AAF609_05330 [Cyanobacteria bacterium P01_C01_bin.120]